MFVVTNDTDLKDKPRPLVFPAELLDTADVRVPRTGHVAYIMTVPAPRGSQLDRSQPIEPLQKNRHLAYTNFLC